MMNDDTKKYYDAESTVYSKKRYEGPLTTYTQFLFRRRLAIFLDYLKRVVSEKEKISLMEVGCADGVIIGKILATFPESVEKVLGLDISPQMVIEARRAQPDPRASFALRGEEPQEKYDVVIELGVHTEDLEKEIAYVKSYLKDDGYYVYSVAGKNSLHARIKLRHQSYAQDYLTYNEAETTLRKHFEIIASRPYGLMVPKLWSAPPLARVLQPLFDMLFSFITPSLFHEKIYLLKNKTE